MHLSHDVIFGVIAAMGGGLAYWDRSKLKAGLAKAESLAKVAESNVKADEAIIRKRVADDLNKVLNDIRNDSDVVAKTHPFQVIARVRAELAKVL